MGSRRWHVDRIGQCHVAPHRKRAAGKDRAVEYYECAVRDRYAHRQHELCRYSRDSSVRVFNNEASELVVGGIFLRDLIVAVVHLAVLRTAPGRQVMQRYQGFTEAWQ